MILEGEHLILRPATMEDLPAYYKWEKDYEVMKYQDLPSDFAAEDFLRAAIADPFRMLFAITKKDIGEQIGSIELKLIPPTKSAELGIAMGEKSEWNKGYAQEACRMIINYAFTNLRYLSIELRVHKDNAAAIHIYKKLGFKNINNF